MKDTKNKDAALKLLNFLAQPENVALVAKASGEPAGIEGVDVDLGQLTQWYNQYKDTRVLPYFDRVYLPNGMFDSLDKGAQDLLSGGVTPQQYVDNLKAEYTRLHAAMAATPAATAAQ